MKKSEFDKLQAKWDAKLKKFGFHDIESRATGRLENNTTSGGVIDKRRVTWESQAEYYALARYFLNDYDFKDNVERIIWEYHTEGISIRDITDILNKVRKKKVSRKPIWETVHRLENEMKKMYGVTSE